jgi:flavin-binding protein dodecin
MSVYRFIDVIGTSPNSWEDAAKEALTTARQSLRNLRVAEASEFDITVNDAGEIEQYRTKLRVSFKYEPSSKP